MTSDVLIIGGGITARRAAAIIAEKYSVTLVSDGAGASPYIHGLNVPLLEEDSRELFLSDTLKSGKYQNDPLLAQTLVSGAFGVREEFSCDFDKKEDGGYDLLKPLGSSVPRVAGIGGRTGAKILRELILGKKYKELEKTRALGLIKDGESVVGARLFDRKTGTHFSVFAKSVLIASGGFGGIFPFSTNSPDIGGDGAAMAYDAGAELVDMEFIQYEPTVATAPRAVAGKSIITTMLFEGAVIRNKNGERFMDERVGKDALSAGIYREILRGGATKTGGVYYDMTGVPEEMLLGKYRDYFERYEKCGIDIRRTPVEITPAPHTTMGGIKIDSECKTCLVGLFAAGEAAGGVHGANRLGGNAGLEVLVFGDIAGKSIVRFLDEKLNTGATSDGFPELCDAKDVPFDTSAQRALLDGICKNTLGVIKSGDALRKAAECVGGVIRSSLSVKNSFNALRLYNDALTVKLVITAALARTDSVGSHIREDCTDGSGERYSIILKKENGDTTTKRQVIR